MNVLCFTNLPRLEAFRPKLLAKIAKLMKMI